MNKKSIVKYLVTEVVITDSEVKYIDPKIFDTNILALMHIKEIKTTDKKYIIQEIRVFE